MTLQATAFRVPALAGSGGFSRTTADGCVAKAAATAWRRYSERRHSTAASSVNGFVRHVQL